MANATSAESVTNDLSIHRKPVTPGSNSWARSQTESQQDAKSQRHQDPKPTNRDRYENKPMPMLPKETPEHDAKAATQLYIKPAIPLVDRSSPPKFRAVTAPLPSRNLFTNKMASEAQLHRKVGHLKQASSEESKRLMDVPQATGKAAQILGIDTNKIKSQHLASSQPGFVKSADSSPDMDHVRLVEPSREPLGRSVPSNHVRWQSQGAIAPNLPKVDLSTSSIKCQSSSTQKTSKMQNSKDAPNAFLAPPNIASHGKVGERPLIQNPNFVRVESVQGIIEHTQEKTTSNEEKPPMEHAPSHTRNDKSDLGPWPAPTYSRSMYEGVWENDPAVGYSLPPFSPMAQTSEWNRHFRPNPLHFPTSHHPKAFDSKTVNPCNSDQNSSATTSSFNRKDHGNNLVENESSHGIRFGQPSSRGYRSKLASANSWASDAKGNSLVSELGQVSALLPPYWPYHSTNSVPSPPQTYETYERPGSLSAGLSHLDLTIHHHIDTALTSIKDHVTVRSDRVLDLMLRRFEGFEDAFKGSLRSIEAEMKNIRKEVLETKTEMGDLHAQNDSIKERIHGISEQMTILQNTIEDRQLPGQDAIASINDSESRPSTRGRAGSTPGVWPQSNEFQPSQNRLHRVSSKVRTRKGTEKTHRSTASKDEPAKGARESRHLRYEAFDVPRDPAPDIRKHPAYAGIPQSYQLSVDQNGSPINGLEYAAGLTQENQPFGDNGWYQQAYGTG